MRITFLGNFNVDYTSETHHKKSLEALGHTVIALQEGAVTAYQVWDQAIRSDVFIWVHTHGWQTRPVGKFNMEAVLKDIKKDGIPSLTYHLDLWFGLKRQADLETDPVYKHIEHFFTCDKQMADWFNENTEVKGHYMPAGVFQDELNNPPEDREYLYDVAFVGSKQYHDEWPYRPKLINWLEKTYGDRFIHVGRDGKLGITRGEALNDLYAKTKVVVGDTLCINFDYPYYWSDRLYETIGRGGFIIFPQITGIQEEYSTLDFKVDDGGFWDKAPDPVELVTYPYDDFKILKQRIDYYIEHDDEREKIRRAGFERTERDHTYVQRWKTILETI
jgi:hypothetical protein